ncbi:MAG: flavin-containing monooxygenase [Solirubrobacteraceae bacterium]
MSDLKIAIVGGGFGGIAAAIELQKHGFSDLSILERSSELGGTWFHNTYPGAACDVPSHLYSFSFAQRRDWPRLCPEQREILAYLRGVARDYGVDRLVAPNSEVTDCVWDDEAHHWELHTSDGHTHTADAVIVASGQLHRPTMPSIEGVQTFAGHSFHSAQWDHGYDLTGKRVAVIGSGASAVQFVPEIARRVDRLMLFQRTGNWFLPRRNRPYPQLIRSIIARIPGVQALRRKFIFYYSEMLTYMIRHPRTLGRVGQARSAAFMRSQLKDPVLRERLWPDYTFGCKRVLFSSFFLAALEEPNVDVVTEPIVGVTPQGILSADGHLHEVDCIIYATGFQTTRFMFPMRISGMQGHSLSDAWAEGPHAHLGMTVPGFPSMFVMYGPNTNTSGGSIIVYLEAQARYIRQALQLLRDSGAQAIEVRAEVEAASDRALQARFAGTAWTQCDSWYRDQHGRIVANWPGYMREYIKRTQVLDRSEYELIAPAEREPALS